MQKLMMEMSSAAPVTTAGAGAAGVEKGEIKPCRVCKEVKNTFRCARCRIAFYCGKEHQAMDWPVHKVACKKAPKDS